MKRATLQGGMNDTTTYVVHITAASPEEAGRAMQAAAARGLTDVRFSALQDGERRPVNQDELGRILSQATAREASHAWDADSVIAALEEIGHEDAARDLYGDERVDEWFRVHGGIDPDTARGDG